MRPMLAFASSAALAAAPLPAALAQGSTMAQDDWVQTSAIQWSGGVRVASGNAGAAGDDHEIEYTVVAGQSPPPRGPGSLSSSGKPAVAQEMDSTSPKLAQFAINGNSPGPCRVGTRYPALRLNDGSNRWLLTDVAVSRCGTGGMTVRYKSRTMVAGSR